MLTLTLFSVLAALARAEHLVNNTEYATGALGVGPYQTFKSSDSKPSLFNFHTLPPADTTPGHLFIATWGDNVTAPGAYIHDSLGEMIWDGSALSAGYQAMNLRPGTYKNQSVLALWVGAFDPNGFGMGHGLLLDQHYNLVANISSTAPGNHVDFHEFALTDNNTALLSSYVPKQMDLSPFGANTTDGWILDCYAQEVDIETGKEIWSWSALDHVSPNNSFNLPIPPNAGTEKHPWDFFHLNNVERGPSGDYMISSRHFSTLYHLSAANGSILWELGGKQPTWKMDDNAWFHFQHDARFHGEDTVSLFDNGAASWNGSQIEPSSRGLILKLANGTASVAHEFHPYNGTSSRSQGNNRVQPDGRWLVGWGQVPAISEYDINGTMLWSAAFGVGDFQSYRVFRGNWTAYPKTSPNLTISNDNGKHTAYVSWNGATEVASWEILGSAAPNGTASSLANATRNGFETNVTVPEAAFFQARALSANGSTLGWSDVVAANGTDAAPPSPAQTSAVWMPGNGTFSASETGKPTSAAGKAGVWVTGVLGAVAAVMVL